MLNECALQSEYPDCELHCFGNGYDSAGEVLYFVLVITCMVVPWIES